MLLPLRPWSSWSEKQCGKGSQFTAISACVFCGAKRHGVAWSYRSGGLKQKLRVTTGGSCFCCVKAAKLLECSRSQSLVSAAGALSPF